jgi:enoyl-CoA hydratase
VSDTFFTLERRDDGVAHLQLSRPERLNTMTPEFFPALRDAVQRAHAEGLTRVLVISSTGKHFSAGMALDVFGGGMADAGHRQRPHAGWPSRTGCAS